VERTLEFGTVVGLDALDTYVWVPETRPGMLSRRFARRDRILRDAARPP